MSPTHGQFRGRENGTSNGDFDLSGEHLDCLVAAVTHSLGTQLGNYVHALKSAQYAIENEDMAAVHACLQDSEREMFIDLEEKHRSQPSLAKIFDDPLSVAQHAPAYSELARVLRDPATCAAIATAVTPFIRAFNEPLEPAFRAMQEQHRHVVEIGMAMQCDTTDLEVALTVLLRTTQKLIEEVSLTKRAWLCAVRGTMSESSTNLSLKLHARMDALLHPIE